MSTGSGDPWSPLVYGAPVDGGYSVGQGRLMEPFAGIIWVVSRVELFDETFWNGSTFVPASQFALPPADRTQAVPGAFVATMTHYLRWNVTIPWSVIGQGDYRLRAFRKPAGSSEFCYSSPWSQSDATVHGQAIANPAGVRLGSDFGGTDALRVTDHAKNGIAGVLVTASVMPAGNNIVFIRDSARTDADGRWAFDLVCQPNTEHRLDFVKEGLIEKQVVVTTGAAA